MLSSRYAIDYESFLSQARVQGAAYVAHELHQQLPSIWREVYLRTIAHEPNLVRFRYRTFEYICDLYSQLEATGSVSYDQTIADRVIGGLAHRREHKRAGLSGE